MSKKIPDVIKGTNFDFNWSEERVDALNVPVEEINISNLLWHIYVPFWQQGSGSYNLQPNDVLGDPQKYNDEYKKIMDADTDRPIDIMYWTGRWVILDGLHRLMKQVIQGENKVKVRRIDPKYIKDIRI